MEPAEAPPRATTTNYRLIAKLTAFGSLSAVFVIFALQNADEVTVEFLWWSFTTLRIFVIAGSAVIGVVLWILGGTARRRRHRA